MFYSIVLLFSFLWQCIKNVKIRKTDSVRCLLGKTAIVTGGNSGIGFADCLLLASRGCKIIMADCVNGEKSVDEIKRRTGNANISYEYLDLSSLQNVRDFANKINENEKKIDILVNNAGICTFPQPTTEDGLNYVMQVNVFGAFLLTHLLLDCLKAAGEARVIFMGSVTSFKRKLKLDSINFTDFQPTSDNLEVAYCNSKLCNILVAQEFAQKLEKNNILTYAVDPLAVSTAIFDDPLVPSTAKIGKYVFETSALDAAQTVLHVVLSDDVRNRSGGYFCCLFPMVKPIQLLNPKFCQAIWSELEKLVKLEHHKSLV